ncbi:MAG: aquaporin [Bacteroidota bacterium]
MRLFITEFIGTFFLVLVIGLTVLDQTPFAPVAIGVILMVMVYMGGHVSGAHYNPAVSIGMVLRGKLDVPTAGLYIAAQVAGGIAAALLAYGFMGEAFMPAPGSDVSTVQALGVEVVFTFALMLVILHVATAPATAGNQYFGLAIGFTVLAIAFAGGGISGGAYNPAVGLGPAVAMLLVGEAAIGHVWLYLVGPILGAVLAVGCYRLQVAPDEEPEKAMA